jgi:large subunit ribosomal protein L15
VKISDLDIFKDKGEAGIAEFIESGVISKLKDGVKLLSDGDIDFPIKVKVHRASQKAVEKIKAQGGDVEVLQ